MPFTRPGPSQPPPCPPMQSRIPVRMGPNPRGHRPIMSYSRPDPPPQQPPFRYTMVPGSRGRLRRMHPPSFYQQIAQNYPENPNLSMRELLNLHPGTRPWFRALGSAAFQGPRDKLKVQPGERASFFEEDICGTDPNNPYGTAYIAPDFEEYGVLNDDPDAFVIASDIPACPPNYDWETMEQVQNEMIEAAKAGVDFVKQNWNRAFQGQAPTLQSDDWGDTMMDTDIDEWTSATDFLEAEGTIGPQVVFEQQDEQEVRVQIPGDGGPRQVFGLDVIHEDCED